MQAHDLHIYIDEPQRIRNNFELFLYLSINICSVDARLLDVSRYIRISVKAKDDSLFSDNLKHIQVLTGV